MKKNEEQIKNFLSKILISDSISKEMREEALALRDTLFNNNIAVIKPIDEIIKFNNSEYKMSDLEKCAKRAMINDKGETLVGLGSLRMIREVKNFYGNSLIEAKNLVCHLREKGIFMFI